MTRPLFLLSLLLLSPFLKGQAPLQLPVYDVFHYDNAYAFDGPMISHDGTRLFLSLLDHPRNYGIENKADIWLRTKEGSGNVLSKPLNLSAPANSRGSDLFAGLRYDEQVLFAVRNGNSLFRLEKEGRLFELPQRMRVPGVGDFEEISDWQVTTDGALLLLSGARDGQTDIFLAERTGLLEWGPLIPLNRLNSNLSESTVFLAADHKTIYFSSGRYSEEGTERLFVSRRLGEGWEKWSDPVLLEGTIDQSKETKDFSVNISGDQGWWLEDGRLTQGEILKQQRPQAALQVKGKLLTGGVHPENEAKICYFPLELPIELHKKNGYALKGQSDFSILLPEPKAIGFYLDSEVLFSSSYVVRAGTNWQGGVDFTPQSYLPNPSPSPMSGASGSQWAPMQSLIPVPQDIFSGLTSDTQIRLDIEVADSQKEQAVQLGLIQYASNAIEPLEFAREDIDRLVIWLQRHPELRANIIVYTHAGCQTDFANSLTRQRADLLVAKLISAGIDPNRLNGKGQGALDALPGVPPLKQQRVMVTFE